MKVRISCVAALSVLLIACGSDDDDDTPQVEVVEGGYSIAAISDTQFDVDGGTCGDASGDIDLTDGALIGSVLSTNGLPFDVSGTVGVNGFVDGGFANGGEILATFEGQFDGPSGNGTWEDTVECSGTWEATKTEE